MGKFQRTVNINIAVDDHPSKEILIILGRGIKQEENRWN